MKNNMVDVSLDTQDEKIESKDKSFVDKTKLAITTAASAALLSLSVNASAQKPLQIAQVDKLESSDFQSASFRTKDAPTEMLVNVLDGKELKSHLATSIKNELTTLVKSNKVSSFDYDGDIYTKEEIEEGLIEDIVGIIFEDDEGGDAEIAFMHKYTPEQIKIIEDNAKKLANTGMDSILTSIELIAGKKRVSDLDSELIAGKKRVSDLDSELLALRNELRELEKEGKQLDRIVALKRQLEELNNVN